MLLELEIDSEHQEFPPVEITVWLLCTDPIDSNFHGSELVVVWYRDTWKDESLSDIFYEGTKAIPWDEVAEGFYW